MPARSARSSLMALSIFARCACRAGMSPATGRPRLVVSMSSPCVTLSRSEDRCVCASNAAITTPCAAPGREAERSGELHGHPRRQRRDRDRVHLDHPFDAAYARATKQGEIVINAHRFRTRERNREDALERLISLIRRAAVPPKPRKATRPTRASKLRRVEDKRRRSQLKHTRRRPGPGPRFLIRNAIPRLLVHNGHEARASALAGATARATHRNSSNRRPPDS